MGNVINLRTARKRAARTSEAAGAAQNRALHGQSKPERLVSEARREKARRDLDQHRIQDGEEQ